jgi:uncharacterized membrane protein
MSTREQANPYRISKERLETMVDAIFAFAMTLLVLGIQTPSFSVGQASLELPGYIGHIFPQIILFVIAFLVLALFWLEHHRQFYYVRLADPAILWLNVAILIFIVLIPFTTDISGDYGGVQIAVLLFHVNFLAIGTLFLTQWVYLSRSCHLCIEELDPATASTRLWFLALTPVCALAGIAVSFYSPSWSLAAYLLIPVFTIILRFSFGRGKGKLQNAKKL